MIREILKNYIENEIFKVYEKNEKGHGVKHIQYVIDRSLKFAQQLENIDIEMVYVIAAFHDIGHHIDAKKHEIISAEILRNDKVIKDLFKEEQIKLMAEAIEDHRSSSSENPRTIYGKIVSSADRNISVSATLKRCFSYQTTHGNNLNIDETIEKCRLFLLKKYGVDGYARNKIYFRDDDYVKFCDELTRLANNKEKFSLTIKNVNNI